MGDAQLSTKIESEAHKGVEWPNGSHLHDSDREWPSSILPHAPCAMRRWDRISEVGWCRDVQCCCSETRGELSRVADLKLKTFSPRHSAAVADDFIHSSRKQSALALLWLPPATCSP